jgi:Zinc finger, C3HC4 type (RING finger)
MSSLLDLFLGLFSQDKQQTETNGDIDGQAKKKRKSLLNFKICKKKAMKTSQRKTDEYYQQPKLLEEVVSIRHNTPDVICPICLKFMCHAAVASCGHSFCDICLIEYLMLAPVTRSSNQACIVCGKHIRNRDQYAKCKQLDNIVEQ